MQPEPGCGLAAVLPYVRAPGECSGARVNSVWTGSSHADLSGRRRHNMRKGFEACTIWFGFRPGVLPPTERNVTLGVFASLIWTYSRCHRAVNCGCAVVTYVIRGPAMKEALHMKGLQGNPPG